MINILYILPKKTSKKGMLRFVKGIAASNLALGLVVLPTNSPAAATVLPNDAQANLIIPQTKLDTVFHVIPESVKNKDKIQIPIVFRYMSQSFSGYHPAIDLATDYGASIRPVMSGTVIEAGFSTFGYGNEIVVDHGNGLESLYAHLSKIEVKKGEAVNLDTELGLVGTTGHSTGPHLHLEIHKNGKSINPLTILPPITRTQYSSLITSAVQIPITLNQQ